MADEIGSRGAPRGERKPLAGYLRLTVDRHGNKVGYDVQQRAIEKWAEYAGETIGRWYKDKDLTAADMAVERPDYELMLSDVQRGLWGGIVVWRLDRLVRMCFEIERCFRITEATGTFIVSIDPTTIDARDTMGKMFMRMMVMFAEVEIDSMRARQKGHQLEKAMSGKYKGGGSRAFGFEGAMKDEHGRILNPGRIGIAHVPAEAALIRECARRLLNGETYSEILHDWLDRDPPVRGSKGDLMSTTTLRQIMHSPRIAGLRDYKELDPETGKERTLYAQAQWDPIISKDDWRRIVAISIPRGRGRPHEYLLTGGCVICGNCGKRMIGNKQGGYKGSSKPGYACEGGVRAKALGHCSAVRILSEPVDKLVVEAVMQRLARSPELLDAVDRDIESSPLPLVTTAMETLGDCDRKLAEFAELAALPAAKGGISRAEWMTFRASVIREREQAVRTIETHRSTRVVPMPLGRDRLELKRWYEALSLAQRRAFISAHVASVHIDKATRRGASPGTQSGASVDLSRVRITFTDTQKADAGSNEAGIGDLGANALRAAPPVQVL